MKAGKDGKELGNEAQKNDKQTFSARWNGNEGKGHPCSVMMKQLPETVLESRDCIELVDLLKEIFLDKVLKVSL